MTQAILLEEIYHANESLYIDDEGCVKSDAPGWFVELHHWFLEFNT